MVSDETALEAAAPAVAVSEADLDVAQDVQRPRHALLIAERFPDAEALHRE